mmetsp:Transcript_104590/g.301552  ORF Transcript_104590/g.301552 Transcript_104590/m.301552 type:complete len:309 (-) Transcript_104590:29-955(-)
MERHFDDVSSTRRRFSGNLVSAWGSRQRRGYHSRECRSDGCTSNTILVQTNGLCTICNGEIRKTQAKAKILMILVFRRIMFAQLASGWNTWVEGFRSLKQRQQDAQEEELEAHRLAAENAAFLRSERKRKVVAEKAAAERAADGAARLFGVAGGTPLADSSGGRVGGTPLADSMGRPLGTSLDSVAGPSASASVMQKASSHSGNAGKPHAKKPHAKKPLAKAASFKKIGGAIKMQELGLKSAILSHIKIGESVMDDPAKVKKKIKKWYEDRKYQAGMMTHDDFSKLLHDLQKTPEVRSLKPVLHGRIH